MDMLHFQETGRSVTGLYYKALPYGPVPADLYKEVQDPRADMATVLSIQSPPKGDTTEDAPKGTRINVAKNPGTDDLTKRELRIVGQLTEIFRDVNAEDISVISHEKNGPWDVAKTAGNGKWGYEINFMDSLNIKLGNGVAKSREDIEESFADYEELRAQFG